MLIFLADRGFRIFLLRIKLLGNWDVCCELEQLTRLRVRLDSAATMRNLNSNGQNVSNF